MLLEIETQVKKGFGKCAFDTEQECDQKPSKASISVKERMNGLKLNMAERGLEKQRDSRRSSVEKLFQGAHTCHQMFGWRRGESRTARTSSPDPVLRLSEFTGALRMPRPLERSMPCMSRISLNDRGNPPLKRSKP